MAAATPPSTIIMLAVSKKPAGLGPVGMQPDPQAEAQHNADQGAYIHTVRSVIAPRPFPNARRAEYDDNPPNR